MKENGYEAYEISNYAKPGFRSRHNSAYWKFIPYLGFGPSAHSFDGKTRQWNVSSVQQYMSASGIINLFEQEILSKQDFYNDYVMVALRTSEGIDINYLHERFGQELPDYCIQSAAPILQPGFNYERSIFEFIGYGHTYSKYHHYGFDKGMKRT